jgi:hypothetical protein
MAIQRNTAITGTIGDAIFYQSGSKYYIRKKGNTGRQAPVAQKQASLLGKASAVSARLRSGFKPLLADPGNRKLMYRLNNVLQQWLRTEPMENTNQVNDINLLKGFSLRESGYGDVFYAAMPVNRGTSDNLSIHIPSFDSPNPIAPLPFNGDIHLHIITLCCNINTPTALRSFETMLDISYTGVPVPSRELPLSIQPAAGELTVVAVSVNNMTAGIVGAMWN